MDGFLIGILMPFPLLTYFKPDTLLFLKKTAFLLSRKTASSIPIILLEHLLLIQYLAVL